MEKRDFIRRAMQDGPKNAVEAAVWCRSKGLETMDGAMAGTILGSLKTKGEVDYADGKYFASPTMKAVVEDKEDKEDKESLPEKILNVLRQLSPGDADAVKIYSQLSEETSLSCVRTTLGVMAKQGRIQRTERGRYAAVNPLTKKDEASEAVEEESLTGLPVNQVRANCLAKEQLGPPVSSIWIGGATPDIAPVLVDLNRRIQELESLRDTLKKVYEVC